MILHASRVTCPSRKIAKRIEEDLKECCKTGFKKAIEKTLEELHKTEKDEAQKFTLHSFRRTYALALRIASTELKEVKKGAANAQAGWREESNSIFRYSADFANWQHADLFSNQKHLIKNVAGEKE